MSKPNIDDPQTTEQLKGITIIIDSVDYDDDDNPYSVSKVYRGDLEGSIEKFIEAVEENSQIVEFSQMMNK